MRYLFYEQKAAESGKQKDAANLPSGIDVSEMDDKPNEENIIKEATIVPLPLKINEQNSEGDPDDEP